MERKLKALDRLVFEALCNWHKYLPVSPSRKLGRQIPHVVVSRIKLDDVCKIFHVKSGTNPVLNKWSA